ncbi:MAG: sss: transporter, solute:sodium symporter family [Firmicutes bacterium]|nr:sss: transporter, solute:sodium symporter family [Bacillota bacterium]
MELTYVHLITLVATIIVVIGSGIYSARTVKSAEGYSLGGRSSGVPLIAGSIAGTVIGGGATVGTAQLAFSLGLSAWWFTLGSGIGFIIMGLFYARPLRKSGLETIPQYLVLNYGKLAGPLASIIASIGIFFSAVASCLPGIQIVMAMFHVSPWLAAIIILVLVLAYVFFGGMKGAGVSGFMKLIIIWVTLFIAGGTALFALRDLPSSAVVFPAYPWFSLFGNGVGNGLGNLFSLIVGIICTQTYIQAVFSAADSRTAAVGAFTAALVTIPVGLPSIVVAMFMHVAHPDVLPILVLPSYLVQYQPAWLGGIGLAGILLSLIGSISGLTFGIGTMVSKDFCYELFKIKTNKTVLWVNRFTILVATFMAAVIAILNLKSQVLFWNYMSMALRGGGVFLPLSLAIFAPGKLTAKWAIASMILSTAAAIGSKLIGALPIDPLFVGLTVSAGVIIIGIIYGAVEKNKAPLVEQDSHQH